MSEYLFEEEKRELAVFIYTISISLYWVDFLQFTANGSDAK